MTLLLFQLLSALCTAIIAINGLKKDLRSTKIVTKKDAKNSRTFIIIVTAISFGLICYSYVDSKSQKQDLVNGKKLLNEKLDSIRKSVDIKFIAIKATNDSLRKILDKNSITVSNRIIESQKQSAKSLDFAADKLHDLINGSDSVPLFKFAYLNDSLLTGSIYITDKKPAYNVKLGILNFDNYIKCPYINVGKRQAVKTNCIRENFYLFPLISVMNSEEKDYPYDIPKGISRRVNKTGRFLIIISFKSKIYKEEAIYDFTAQNTLQALRVLERKGDKTVKIWIPKSKFYELKGVDWDKEFPEKYLADFYNLNF